MSYDYFICIPHLQTDLSVLHDEGGSLVLYLIWLYEVCVEVSLL